MIPYAHGEVGLNTFVLESKVEAPVDTILDPRTTEAHRRMLVHLRQPKRVKNILGGGWMRLVGDGTSRG